MQYSIENNNIKAVVQTDGAELISVMKDGKERLWQNNGGGWDKHAPILFPFAGRVAVNIEGKNYPFIPHGFAKDCNFDVAEKDERRIILRLKSDEKTKTYYPYDFNFYITYTVIESGVQVDYRVENTGNQTLGYAIGGHHSFALNGSPKNYVLAFDKDEEFDCLQDENGVLNGKVKSLGCGRILSLETDLLSNGGSIILKGIKSRTVTLAEKDGLNEIAKISFTGFDNFVVWTSDLQMVCLEPWMNLPDGVNDSKDDFLNKLGIEKVKPNNSSQKQIILYYN